VNSIGEGQNYPKERKEQMHVVKKPLISLILIATKNNNLTSRSVCVFVVRTWIPGPKIENSFLV
jgi:hypothetical protein